MDEAKAHSKKRRLNPSQSSDNSGDEGKKRGRPRVERQDESAADVSLQVSRSCTHTNLSQRRRTQIRKAQRAYRQRKESTLEELRRRVADLSNVMERMNKVFVDCSDRLAGSGLSADQASHIRDAEMQFGTLMRCVRNSEEGCSPVLTARIHQSSSNESRSRVEPMNVPLWMDESVLATTRHGNSQRDIIEFGKQNPSRVDALEPRNVPSWMDESVLATARRGNLQRDLIEICKHGEYLVATEPMAWRKTRLGGLRQSAPAYLFEFIKPLLTIVPVGHRLWSCRGRLAISRSNTGFCPVSTKRLSCNRHTIKLAIRHCHSS